MLNLKKLTAAHRKERQAIFDQVAATLPLIGEPGVFEYSIIEAESIQGLENAVAEYEGRFLLGGAFYSEKDGCYCQTIVCVETAI